jgi:hypothetical protein
VKTISNECAAVAQDDTLKNYQDDILKIVSGMVLGWAAPMILDWMVWIGLLRGS